MNEVAWGSRINWLVITTAKGQGRGMKTMSAVKKRCEGCKVCLYLFSLMILEELVFKRRKNVLGNLEGLKKHRRAHWS